MNFSFIHFNINKVYKIKRFFIFKFYRVLKLYIEISYLIMKPKT